MQFGTACTVRRTLLVPEQDEELPVQNIISSAHFQDINYWWAFPNLLRSVEVLLTV
jgi:hypothetical protein